MSGDTAAPYQEVCFKYDGHMLYGYWLDRKSKDNLVLIPGSYTSRTIWEPVLKDADVRANVLLAELPGFGKSTPREPDSTIEAYTRLILRLIDSLAIDRFFIGGHSLGGMMAIQMTEYAKDRIDGVISCEGWTHRSVPQTAFHKLKNETLTEQELALRAHYGSIAKTAWSMDELKQYTKIWRKWEKGWTLLEGAGMPILEIWGDRGWETRPGRDMLMIPQKENIELVWIKNGGHSYLVQNPALIGAHIASFIAKAKGTQ